MGTRENPYVAPLAVPEAYISAETARELLALRQRYVYRETTFRAWGIAKLVMGAFVVLSLISFSAVLAPNTANQPSVASTLAVPVLIYLLLAYAVPGWGLLRLRPWAQPFVTFQSLLYVVLSIVGGWYALLRPGVAFSITLLVALNLALLALLIQQPSQVVGSRKYCDAMRITTLHGVAWPLAGKGLAFLVIEALQMSLFSWVT